MTQREISRSELPYPELRFATSKPGRRHAEYGGTAITAGSGQYREGYPRPGGAVADSEGVMAFGDAGFAFFADGGETFRWRYEDVVSYKTGRTLVPSVKKLNVRMRDGSKASFRIGPQLLANASYIFRRCDERVLAPDERTDRTITLPRRRSLDIGPDAEESKDHPFEGGENQANNYASNATRSGGLGIDDYPIERVDESEQQNAADETRDEDQIQQRTDRRPVHAAIVTRETLTRLVRVGQEHFLNRRADLRISEGRTYVEQRWNTGPVSVEIRPDLEYALVPTRLHRHRAGQETDPHWRCDLYVRGVGGYERQQIVLDVFVRDFDQLPELTVG